VDEESRGKFTRLLINLLQSHWQHQLSLTSTVFTTLAQALLDEASSLAAAPGAEQVSHVHAFSKGWFVEPYLRMYR